MNKTALHRLLPAFLLSTLFLLALAAPAATVRFAWTNYLGQPDTNWFRVYPVGDVAQSDGSFISKGPATRLTPNASGLVTNTFEMGTYVASNSFLNRGIAFRVPNDHGPTVYCATCGTNNTPAGSGLAISGFNYFITLVYGTNPPPTYDEITNSLGFLPTSPQVATNIAAYQALLATNGFLSTATNIAAYQALIATQSIARVAVVPGANTTVTTNGTTFAVNTTGEVTATNVIDVAAGINVTITTNGLLRTIAATATTDPNALTNNETRAAVFRGPNDVTWSMTNRGTASFENGMILSNRTASFEIRTADGVVQLRQQYNEQGIRVTAIGGDGSGLTNINASSGAGTFTGTFTGNAAGLTNRVVRLKHDGWETSFTTLTAAKAAAVAGDTITAAGTFNENNLLKNGVDWHFEPGTYNYFFATTNNPWGIFDDRTTGGPATSKITGSLSFYYSTGTNTVVENVDYGATNSFGAWVQTNATSNVRFDFAVGDGESYWTTGSEQPALLYVSHGLATTKFDRLICSRRATTFSGNQNVISGIIWQLGDMYVDCNEVGQFPSTVYGVWPHEPFVPPYTNVANLWMTCQLMNGYFYASQFSPDYRIWLDVKEIRGGDTGINGMSLGYGGGGKNYVRAEKISSLKNYALDIGGGTNWITVQKLTVPNHQDAKGWLVSGATVFLDVMHYEDLSTNINPRIENSGNLFIRGGRAVLNTNSCGILHTGGYLDVSDFYLDARASAKPPIVVATNNAHIRNSTLLSALTTNSISATSARTVGVYSSTGRQTNHANITLSPMAGWTVDPNAQ